MHDSANFRLAGAETFGDVQARVTEALQEIAEANPGRTVVITSHGVAIRCMLTKLLGVPLNDRETVPIFHNTGVSHLRYENGRFTVDTIDDASHLPPELRQSPAAVTALRHVCVDPGQHRALYERCYADAWLAAHGNLRGFEADSYYRAACDHYRRDRESVMLFYDGEKLAGLLDLDVGRGEHANYGWISLIYLCPAYRGRGAGAQLLGRAVAKYRALGRRAIRLYAAEDNRAAMAFYRHWGFEKIAAEQGSFGRVWVLEKKIGGAGYV
jgi:ribosomal protein S18 acetylase RimI-like enzyme